MLYSALPGWLDLTSKENILCRCVEGYPSPDCGFVDTGHSAEAVASGSVVSDLTHMPPLALLSLTADEQSKALQVLAGRPLRVSLYQLPCSAEDGSAFEPLAIGMLKWDS